jgi:hypothetical protein
MPYESSSAASDVGPHGSACARSGPAAVRRAREAVPLIAAGIAFVGVLIKLWWDTRSARRDRLRQLYAGDWEAVQACKEIAFAIRRRNVEDRSGERVRPAEAMRETQKDVTYFEALIARERSGRVSTEYRTLVNKTEIAGGIVCRSWTEEPVITDSEMHSPEILAELQVLAPFEDGYMNAVADELGARRPH